MELTARHLIDGAVWDDEEQAIAVLIEITDPASARPIDVRFDVVAGDTAKPSARARFIGDVERHGKPLTVYGTYLGVIADEN